MSFVEFYQYFVGARSFDSARICELIGEIGPFDRNTKLECVQMAIRHLSADELRDVLLIIDANLDCFEFCLRDVSTGDKERAEILYDYFSSCDGANMNEHNCLMYGYGFRDDFTKIEIEYFKGRCYLIDLPGIKPNDVPVILDLQEFSDIQELYELADHICSSQKRWIIYRWAQEKLPDKFDPDYIAGYFSHFFDHYESIIDKGFELPADDDILWEAFTLGWPAHACRVCPAKPNLKSKMLIDLYEGRPIDFSHSDSKDWIEVMKNEDFLWAAIHYNNLVSVRQIADWTKANVRDRDYLQLPHNPTHYSEGFFETLEYLYDSGAYIITDHDKCMLRQLAFESADWDTYIHICKKYLRGNLGEIEMICYTNTNLNMYRNLIKFGSVDGWWERIWIESDDDFDKLVLLFNESGFEVPPEAISKFIIQAMKKDARSCYYFLTS